MADKHESVGRLISIMHKQIRSYVSKELDKYKLGSGQFFYILRLYKKDGLSQEELAKHINKDKGTAARAIKKLEEEGYVTREINSQDKRSYKIYLTQKAVDIKPKIMDVLQNSTRILERGLSEEEKATVLRILKKMTSNSILFLGNKEDEGEDYHK